MNDAFSGKNGKVRVMYVRSEEDNNSNQSNKRPAKNRADKVRTRGGNQDRSASAKGQQESPYKSRSTSNSPYKDRGAVPKTADHDASHSSPSPWKTVPLAQSNETSAEQQAASDKPWVDPDVMRKQRAEETRVYGENACQALFNHRPEAIVRAWFIKSVTPRFKEALRWMAANKKAYHVVDDAELAKASGTEHHGGVCFIIKKRLGMAVEDYLSQASQAQDCILALENITNPHNLGGIVRSCAHFGIQAVLLNDVSLLESGAAIRTAEGGAEHIRALDGSHLDDALDTFRRAGYTIVSTSSHKKSTPLAQAILPKKMVLVLGEERDGLSDSVLDRADLTLAIGGTGNVESLNVSVATGILLAEWWRQSHIQSSEK